MKTGFRNSLFRIVGQSAEAELDVVTTTLDEFCTGKGISRIQILKVDAEGADLRVLKGALGSWKAIKLS